MKIFRWILMPFAAVIGFIVVYAFSTFICKLNSFGYMTYTAEDVTSLTQILLYLFVNGISGSAFVYAGSLTAPSSRKTVSIILATVISMFSIVSTIYYLYIHFSLVQSISCACTIAGAVLASFKIANDEGIKD